MWDRREVLIAGAAGALAANLAALASTTGFPKVMVVADTRFAESTAFALEAAKSGHRLAMVDGDVTALWYGTLDQLWRNELIPIAGLTGSDVLFCLERLAMDRGLRVVFKGEHRRFGNDRLSRAITAPPPLVSWAIAARRNAAGIRA
jgi:hypothetical protein